MFHLLLIYYSMVEIVFILLVVFVILKLLYDRYTPHIDVIRCFNKHTVILWYNKKTSKNVLGSKRKGEIMRTYIKLFEYE